MERDAVRVAAVARAVVARERNQVPHLPCRQRRVPEGPGCRDVAVHALRHVLPQERLLQGAGAVRGVSGSGSVSGLTRASAAALPRLVRDPKKVGLLRVLRVVLRRQARSSERSLQCGAHRSGVRTLLSRTACVRRPQPHHQQGLVNSSGSAYTWMRGRGGSPVRGSSGAASVSGCGRASGDSGVAGALGGGDASATSGTPPSSPSTARAAAHASRHSAERRIRSCEGGRVRSGARVRLPSCYARTRVQRCAAHSFSYGSGGSVLSRTGASTQDVPHANATYACNARRMCADRVTRRSAEV
jgi:hypothetical protein